MESEESVAAGVALRERVEQGSRRKNRDGRVADVEARRRTGRAGAAMKRLYGMFADLGGRRAVVIGGGELAERKVRALAECGAAVVVISPEITAGLAELGRAGAIEIERRRYRRGDLAEAWLVVCACGEREAAEAVAAEARERRVFCNVADEPGRCSFHVPAVVAREGLQVAISTGGASPALARRIKEKLEGEFGAWYGRLVRGLEELREHVKAKHPRDEERRAAVLRGFVDSEGLELLAAGREEEFERLLEEWKKK